MATSVNEFDTFDYLKPADYVPGLRKRYDEMNQGFEDAEQIAKLNDRQRVANADIMGKAINNALKFSKTAAGKLKEKRDHDQKLYGNEAFDLQTEIGATQAKLHEYRKSREAMGEDHSVAQYLSHQAMEAGNNELAEYFSNLTGWRAQIHNETLGMRWANNLEPNFWDTQTGILSKNEQGKFNNTLTLAGDDEGQGDREVNWSNASLEEKKELYRQWKINTGYTGISHYRKEFAHETFIGKMRAFENKLFSNEQVKDEARQRDERLDSHKSLLIEAAKYGDGKLAKYLHELEQTELGHWKGDASKLRSDFVQLLGTMYLDGDITLDQLNLEGYTFLHRGTNKEESLSVFKEYDEDFTTMKQGLVTKKYQQENADIQLFGGQFTERTEVGLQESGEALTEQTLGHIKAKFDQEFLEEFGRMPTQKDYPPDLLNMLTVEDQNDADIISNLEAKKLAGEKISYQDYARLYDQTEFDKWNKYAQSARGQGLSHAALKHRKDNVERIVQENLNTTLGYHDFKDRNHGYLLSRATSHWNVLYNEGIGTIDPSDPDAESKFLLEVDDRLAIQLKKWENEPPAPRTARTFNAELKQSVAFLSDARKTGLNVRQALTSGLIPGSETHLKRLEQYAITPGAQLPEYYHRLAKTTGLTPWQAANLQYQAKYPGKELPPVSYMERSKDRPSIINYLNLFYGSRGRAGRAKVIETGADINDISLLTEGILWEAAK